MKSFRFVFIFSISALMPFLGQCAFEGIDVVVSSGTAFLKSSNYYGSGIDLKLLSNADVVEKAELKLFQVKDSAAFIVVSISGPSRKNGGSHFCGAGEEENLVWMKLADNMLIQDVRSILISSCLLSVDLDSFDVTDDSLKAHYASICEKKEFDLAYDNDSPEKGFVISISELKLVK